MKNSYYFSAITKRLTATFTIMIFYSVFAQSQTSYINIYIDLDSFEEQTTWTLTGPGGFSESGGPYSSTNDIIDLDFVANTPGSYTFTINDSSADGISDNSDGDNENGLANYRITADNVVNYTSGNLPNFGSQDIQIFLVDPCDATISGNLDTDGDNVTDICDLDDDNDGILDEDEGCEMEINTLEYNGTFGVLSSGTRDLENGASGGYSYSTSLQRERRYAVVANNGVAALHSWTLWEHISGHTTGASDDAFLAVNGSTNIGVFYSQTLTIDPFTKYYFGLWAINGVPPSAAASYPFNIGIRILDDNSNLLYETSTGDITSTNWVQVTRTFNSGLNTIVTLEVYNISTAVGGNDFAIDDIFLSRSDGLLACIDTDSDGLTDNLDLDSDGDGCPDAVEGAGTYTEYDLITSTLDGGSSNVFTNLGTTVDADGIPTNTGSPQATTAAVTNASDSDACKADLRLAKHVQQGGVDVGSVNIGSIITFIITVTNDGPHPVTNLEVTDNLPAGLTGISVITTAGTFDLGTGLWDLASYVLAVGDSETIAITATVGTDCTNLTNIAEITAMDREDEDSTPNNAQ